jgi:Secretion system C-terminal sorting domain
MIKRILFIGLAVSLWAGSYYFFSLTEKVQSREDYEAFINNHPYSMALRSGVNEEEEHRPDRPDLAMMQDYLFTMDPSVHRPTPLVLLPLNNQTALMRDGKNKKNPAARGLSSFTAWEERGPKQVGGRTRAVMFDPNDATKKKVWAGGVSGGLWFNNDITNASSTWTKADDFWDNLAVSCIAADPNNPQIFYVGTGEFEWTVRGGGIWKTTNGGTNWTRLTSTQGFLEIRDVAVRNEAGTSVVYAAVRPGFGGDNPANIAGLFRSTNGGTTWQQVLPLAQGSSQYSNFPTDIEISSDQTTIWVGTAKHFWENGANSTIYKSTTGLIGSWGAGVSTFVGLKYTGQIKLAAASSNKNIVYAAIEHDGKIGGIFKSTDGGTVWASKALPQDADLGIPANDFTRGQAWWDLALSVNPANPENCFIGAVDFFASTDGATSWTQITKWSNNANLNTLNISLVHADQHSLVFRPGFPLEAVVTNDGGVFYSANILAAATSPNSFSARNLNYNVTQFYSGAIHPTLKNFMLGGTQDNGNPKFTVAGLGTTVDVSGGDGALCFIDQKNPTFQIVSYVNNDISLSTDGGNSFNTKLINDNSTGHFINKGDYDSNLKILFTARNETSIYRVRNVSTSPALDNLVISNLGSMASALRISPYSTTASNLYLGTGAGKLFKVLNAHTTPSITEITGPNFPNGSISSIAFGANENQILVTFYNYGVVNIWETRNGGATWANREGNLPNMPVRWAEYHPLSPDQIYIATELGVWSTDNINVASPVWTSTNGGLANVRTDMLRIRNSDKTIMAATHGRGVFTALIPSDIDQTISFKPIPSKTFGDATFKISAQATSGLPVTFASSNTSVATVVDSTVTIVGGGTATFTATQAGNVVYKVATPAIQLLTVNKAAQTITFGALIEKDVNDVPFAVTATSSSTLPVTFASSMPSVAIVVNNTITITGPGTTVIRAMQTGNGNFLAAADGLQNLVVVTRVIQLTGSLDFGDVFLGLAEQKTFTASSIGTGIISVTNNIYPSGFTGTTKINGSTMEFTVTFKPTDVIDYGGNVTIESDATSGVNTMPVKGKGVKITALTDLPNEGVEIYPNPVKDFIYLKTIVPISSIEFVDITGKSWSEVPMVIDKNTSQIDVSGYAPGKYFMIISTTLGETTKQIIKN